MNEFGLTVWAIVLGGIAIVLTFELCKYCNKKVRTNASAMDLAAEIVRQQQSTV